MQDPPSEKFSGCFARVLGEYRGSGHRPGLDALAVFTSPQEGFTMQLRRRLPDSKSGLTIADFTILFLPLSLALAHRDFVKVIGISCRDALSVWVGFRACFFETGAVIGLSGLFRSLWIALGTSVEWYGPEIAGFWDRG